MVQRILFYLATVVAVTAQTGERRRWESWFKIPLPAMDFIPGYKELNEKYMGGMFPGSLTPDADDIIDMLVPGLSRGIDLVHGGKDWREEFNREMPSILAMTEALGMKLLPGLDTKIPGDYLEDPSAGPRRLPATEILALTQIATVFTEGSFGLQKPDMTKAGFMFFRGGVDRWQNGHYCGGCEYIQYDLSNSIPRPARFDFNLETKVIIHGLSQDAKDDSDKNLWGPLFVESYKDAKPFNMIIVDGSKILGQPLTNFGASDSTAEDVDWAALPFYATHAFNTQDLGYHTAKFLQRLFRGGSPKIALGPENERLLDVHCIGHSLGGQTCGRFGRTLERLMNSPMKRLTALDPAGPLFQGEALSPLALRREDAFYVEALHTNSRPFDKGLWTDNTALGYGPPVGHADFYLNGGWEQPECGRIGDTDAAIIFMNGACSHKWSWLTWSETVRTDVAFQGYRCGGWKECMCRYDYDCPSLSSRGPPVTVFGEHKNDFENRGIYFLPTAVVDSHGINHEGGPASLDLGWDKTFVEVYDWRNKFAERSIWTLTDVEPIECEYKCRFDKRCNYYFYFLVDRSCQAAETFNPEPRGEIKNIYDSIAAARETLEVLNTPFIMAYTYAENSPSHNRFKCMDSNSEHNHFTWDVDCCGQDSTTACGDDLVKHTHARCSARGKPDAHFYTCESSPERDVYAEMAKWTEEHAEQGQQLVAVALQAMADILNIVADVTEFQSEMTEKAEGFAGQINELTEEALNLQQIGEDMRLDRVSEGQDWINRPACNAWFCGSKSESSWSEMCMWDGTENNTWHWQKNCLACDECNPEWRTNRPENLDVDRDEHGCDRNSLWNTQVRRNKCLCKEGYEIIRNEDGKFTYFVDPDWELRNTRDAYDPHINSELFCVPVTNPIGYECQPGQGPEGVGEVGHAKDSNYMGEYWWVAANRQECADRCNEHPNCVAFDFAMFYPDYCLQQKDGPWEDHELAPEVLPPHAEAPANCYYSHRECRIYTAGATPTPEEGLFKSVWCERADRRQKLENECHTGCHLEDAEYHMMGQMFSSPLLTGYRSWPKLTATSADDCQAKCSADLFCNLWTYKPETNECWLVELAEISAAPAEGFVSGPKCCSVAPSTTKPIPADETIYQPEPVEEGPDTLHPSFEHLKTTSSAEHFDQGQVSVEGLVQGPMSVMAFLARENPTDDVAVLSTDDERVFVGLRNGFLTMKLGPNECTAVLVPGTDPEWLQVAFTFIQLDGEGKGMMRIYADGDKLQECFLDLEQAGPGLEALDVGQNGATMRDVRVWDRMLTRWEVRIWREMDVVCSEVACTMPTKRPTEMPTPTPTLMPTPTPTKAPTEMPTPSPTEQPTEDVSGYHYTGCYMNHGSARVSGHLSNKSFDECKALALEMGRFSFGMEYPQAYPDGRAQCLILDSRAQYEAMNLRDGSECTSAQRSWPKSQPLGNAHRLAVYTLPGGALEGFAMIGDGFCRAFNGANPYDWEDRCVDSLEECGAWCVEQGAECKGISFGNTPHDYLGCAAEGRIRCLTGRHATEEVGNSHPWTTGVTCYAKVPTYTLEPHSGRSAVLVPYSSLEVGGLVFEDRTYTFNNIGDYDVDCMFTKVSNNDKNTPSSDVQYTITLQKPSMVYLDFWGGATHVGKGFSTWNTGWTLSDKMPTTFGTWGPGVVYKKFVSESTLELMGNQGNGHGTYYAFICPMDTQQRRLEVETLEMKAPEPEI